MADLKRCPFCKSPAQIKTAGQTHPRYYAACFDKDCMVNPTTELFEHEEDAVAAWNKCSETVITDDKLKAIYDAVAKCEDYRAKLSSDMARVKAENETYHFILAALGIRRDG